MRKETGTLEGRQAIVSAVWKRAGCRGDEISSGAAAEQHGHLGTLAFKAAAEGASICGGDCL